MLFLTALIVTGTRSHAAMFVRVLFSNSYCIFFSVQQSFTSNWPKTLWLAVDQRGVHLLEFRTRNVLTSFDYEAVLDYTPSLNHMLLITGSNKKQSKIIVNTNQVSPGRQILAT